MKKTIGLILASSLALLACGKKVAISDAVKNDLKNYLEVELPKSARLMQRLKELQLDYKDESEKKKSPKISAEELESLTDALKHLKTMPFATEDVRGVHAELVTAVEKIEHSFLALVATEKKQGMDILSGVFTAFKGIMEGIKYTNRWNDALEDACKRNGLEAEFKAFHAKYGFKR